jgi:short-subunit dehydrogenase
MRSLIIGGTSGLGYEIAKLLRDSGDDVIITGRKNPEEQGLQFQRFDLDLGPELPSAVDTFVSALPQIDRFVYCAGFYQEGNITELEDHSIIKMLDVSLNAPVWFTRELLKTQGNISQYIAITSSAQETPREKEIIYSAGKAGFAQFANSLSLDPRVGKVLVAVPSGIKTSFWQATKHDTSTFNDPVWVANQIVEALTIDFEYAMVKILRNPARTEVVETR